MKITIDTRSQQNIVPFFKKLYEQREKQVCCNLIKANRKSGNLINYQSKKEGKLVIVNMKFDQVPQTCLLSNPKATRRLKNTWTRYSTTAAPFPANLLTEQRHLWKQIDIRKDEGRGSETDSEINALLQEST